MSTTVNLGRIGFVNKGEWVDGTHKINDVVSLNLKTYVCILAHTSVAGDIPVTNTTYWKLWFNGDFSDYYTKAEVDGKTSGIDDIQDDIDDMKDNVVYTYENIASLRAMPSTDVKKKVFVKSTGGTNRVLNFGANIFVWYPLSTASDNGLNIIKLTAVTTGRYLLSEKKHLVSMNTEFINYKNFYKEGDCVSSFGHASMGDGVKSEYVVMAGTAGNMDIDLGDSLFARRVKQLNYDHISKTSSLLEGLFSTGNHASSKLLMFFGAETFFSAYGYPAGWGSQTGSFRSSSFGLGNFPNLMRDYSIANASYTPFDVIETLTSGYASVPSTVDSFQNLGMNGRCKIYNFPISSDVLKFNNKSLTNTTLILGKVPNSTASKFTINGVEYSTTGSTLQHKSYGYLEVPIVAGINTITGVKKAPTNANNSNLVIYGTCNSLHPRIETFVDNTNNIDYLTSKVSSVNGYHPDAIFICTMDNDVINGDVDQEVWYSKMYNAISSFKTAKPEVAIVMYSSPYKSYLSDERQTEYLEAAYILSRALDVTFIDLYSRTKAMPATLWQENVDNFNRFGDNFLFATTKGLLFPGSVCSQYYRPMSGLLQPPIELSPRKTHQYLCYNDGVNGTSVLQTSSDMAIGGLAFTTIGNQISLIVPKGFTVTSVLPLGTNTLHYMKFGDVNPVLENCTFTWYNTTGNAQLHPSTYNEYFTVTITEK